MPKWPRNRVKCRSRGKSSSKKRTTSSKLLASARKLTGLVGCRAQHLVSLPLCLRGLPPECSLSAQKICHCHWTVPSLSPNWKDNLDCTMFWKISLLRLLSTCALAYLGKLTIILYNLLRSLLTEHAQRVLSMPKGISWKSTTKPAPPLVVKETFSKLQKVKTKW